MLKFFGSSYIIQYVALFLIALVFWIPAFIYPQGMPVNNSLDTPLYLIISGLLGHIPFLVPYLAFLFILVQAILVNAILSFHELIPKNSLLAAFLFVVFFSTSPALQTIYPAMISIFLLIILLHLVFKMYGQEDNITTVFSIAMILSVSSMVYLPVIFLFIFLWQVFLIFRIFSWREWVVSIIGLALPYIYLLTYLWWTGRVQEYMEALIASGSNFLHPGPVPGFLQLSVWGILVIFILLPAVLKIFPRLSTYNIDMRKKLAAISWLAIIGGVIALTGGNMVLNSITLLPVTILAAHYYSTLRRLVYQEIIIACFIILVLAQLYFPV